jgi:pseudouridine-5'-phosphate glycosidase
MELMFNSSTISDAVGTVPEFDSAEVDSIVEVQMRSSQPLPDKMGILNGKYLAGSNESQLIYLTSSGEYRMISMEDLDTICRTPAESGKAKDAQLIEASQPYTP